MNTGPDKAIPLLAADLENVAGWTRRVLTVEAAVFIVEEQNKERGMLSNNATPVNAVVRMRHD